jgi:hypothetical protein
VRALEAENGPASDFPLELKSNRAEIQLGCIAGSRAVQLTCTTEQGQGVRAEVDCLHEETIQIEISLREGNRLNIASAGRRVLYLPLTSSEAPPPLVPAANGQKLDLLFLIDGTTMQTAEVAKVGVEATPGQPDVKNPKEYELLPLVGSEPAWSNFVEKLAGFASELEKKYTQIRTSVLCFGERTATVVGFGAPDLRPDYLLVPSQRDRRTFKSFSKDRLRSTLGVLRYSPGGDFVDALAYALHECHELSWGPDARRLLVLMGDSPGHCLCRPLKEVWQIDNRVRKLDVHWEAERLHRRGIELMTIYYVPKSLKAYVHGTAHVFLEYARQQYEDLASRPQFVFLASSFEPAVAAQAVVKETSAVARGVCLGVMLAGTERLQKGAASPRR